MFDFLQAVVARCTAVWTLIALAVIGSVTVTLDAQTNVLTQHNDMGRTGLNPTETILTPGNVNANLFGKLYSIPIDGQAYAQPLYVSSLKINGVNHSVLFVATEHDSVFAFDTNAQGAILWQASMASTSHGAAAGATSDPLSTTGCTDAQGPEYGIKSTPVIDASTNTLYTTSRTLENGQVVWRLHGLDLTTGNEKFGGPITITASVKGTAPDAVNGVVTFNPKWHNQRPGLLLLNGTVYIAFGSVCDDEYWHGWVMGYSAAAGSLAQTTVFIDTPNGSAGGIWMTGAGLAADTENGVSRIFLSTGNGTYDATLPYGTNNMDYSDDIVALTQKSTGTLSVTDEFTPYNQYGLEQQDLDVSSGGVVVLPDNLPGSKYPHLLVQMSKAASLVLANRDNLGGYSTNSDNDLQEIEPGGMGLWGTPAYWNGNVYLWPAQTSLKQYSLTNGALITPPFAQGPISQTGFNGHPFTGTTVSVSSNGNSNPIVWADDYITYGGYPIQYLYAFDGTNVNNLLWSSAQFPGRNSAGASQKYAIPTIADGKVYVASQGNIRVYGLVSPDFALSVSPEVGIPPTSSSNLPITITNFGGFTGNVALTVSGLPAGVTSSIANGVLTVSVSATAPLTTGATPITITGVSGSLTHSTTLLLSITTSGQYSTPIDISAYYNVWGIQNDGVSPINGGVDGYGYALSEKQLGGLLTSNGITYNLGPAGVADAVTSMTVPISSAGISYSAFNFLASAGGGANQSFVLNYTDGTSSSFTQSMSNWGAPSNYSGETNALGTSYRVTPSGTNQTGPWYVYSYAAPITPGKVLTGVTLPSNANVVILAASFSLTPANTQTITFNSIAPQPVKSSISLTATASSGLAVYYSSTTSSVCTVSGSTATLLTTGTCSIVASQAGNSSYAAATPVTQSITVGNAVAPGSPVSLSSFYNVFAIANNGTAPANGGFDTSGYGYSETLLGSSLTALGVPFNLGAAGVADAVSSTAISIPTGTYAALDFLAAGAFGNYSNQNFVLTFTDGTTSTYTQSVSDWCTPQSYAGETIGLSMAYRLNPSGATQNTFPCYLYAYSLPIPSGKTVKGLTLPSNRDIVLLAVTMAPSTAATPAISPAAGAYVAAQTVTLTDSTPGASIYYTTNGTAPTSASTLYTSPLTVGTSETISAVAVAGGYGNSAIVYSTYAINGTVAAATFSVPGGSYTAAQTVALSDATAGAKIYYTTNGATPTTSSTLYTSPIAVSANETINALAAAPNYGNSVVATATYSIVASGTTAAVNLSSAFNVYGIFNSGTAPTHGGLDSTGYAYAGSTLPSGIMLGGVPVIFGPVAAPDAVANATIALPKGQYGTISVLAGASYGPLPNQTFVVTYTDGTTSTFTQSLSDWGNPQNYAGETKLVNDPQRIIPSGALQAGPWYMYGYSFALNSGKTVSSLTLPAKANVFLFAATLTPAANLTGQTIAFPSIASQTPGTTLTLAATATSGLAVTFTSTSSGVCTVSGSTATLLAAGGCSIVASQAGNSTYAAAPPVTQTITVAAAAQTISFSSIATQIVGTPLSLTAQSTSGLAVSYASSTTGVCTVANSTATFLSAGTCTIAASQPGNATYAAATSVTQSFSVQAATTTAGYDVVLLVGQSNMVGAGTGADDQGDASVDPRIMQWNGTTSNILPAYDQLHQDQGPSVIGLGMTFAKAYVKHMAANRKLLLVGAATGGTGFAEGYWTAGTGAGATTALSWINAAMAGAGPNARLVGILWHQGEYDIDSNGGSAYETNLQNLISYFRTNITGASSSTPFVVGEMVNPWLTSNLSSSNYTSQQNLILNDFHSLPDTLPYTGWVSGAELLSDAINGVVHYSALSQRQLGRRYADKFFEAQNNLTQPQVSQKWWAGTFYDDGRGLGSANTNTIPVNNPATVTGTVTATIDQVRGNVAQISQGGGSLSYQVPGSTFNGSYTKMAWFLPGATGYTNNLISANNSGQVHFLEAANQSSGQILIAAGHSSGTVSAIVSAQVTNPAGAWMNIALAYDSVATTMTLYLNGAVIASQTGVAAAPASSSTLLPVYVGSFGTAGTGIDGEISGARVWTTALNAAQVSAIYTYEAAGTGNEPGFGILPGVPSVVSGNSGSLYLPPSLSIPAASGSTASEPVLVVPNNGFTGKVNLSVTGLPTGLSATFAASKTANNYMMEFSASSAVVAGTYPLAILGTSSTVSAQAALTLTVVNTADEIPVNLSSKFNLSDTIVNDGTSYSAGSVDGQGYAYSASLLGSTVTTPNGQFTLGPANAADAVTSATIPLPTGNFTSIALLGTGLADLTGETFTVAYSDGTTSVLTQSMSNWCGPQQYPGEAIGAATAYRDYDNGTTQSFDCYLYSYALPLNPAKVAQSITLPNTTSVLIMAVTVTGQLTSAGQTSQTIAFAPIASQTAGGTLPLTGTASSGLAVTFTSTTAGVCTVSGGTAALLTAGACSIVASQPGNSSYAAAAPVTQSFNVAAATTAQTISFTAIPVQTVGTTLTLTGKSSSGLAVSYASTTPSVCTVSSTTATLVIAGTCTLTASQGGNASYAAAAPVTQTFSVQAASASVAGYDVVLLVGQSNMVGAGTGADDVGDAASDPRIMQWSGGAIMPAFDPLTQNCWPYNIGLGMTFAKAYVKHMAPNRKLLLIGAATISTGFAGGYWVTPTSTTAAGNGVVYALAWANAAMAAAGPNAHLVGILWHQGENDIDGNGGSAYETNLLNLISYFRANITGASSTTPFVVGEMVNPWLTANLTASSANTAGQLLVLNDFHTLPDTVPYTAWTSAAELTSDPYYGTIHFSALAQRQLGRRYADKLFEAQNNLPQPQVSQKWWAGTFYDDGRGLGSANTNAIPVNNPATVSGTVTAAIDPLRGNVAQISQGNGYLSYQVPGSTFNGSYTKMAWFLPGAAGNTNNLISANNSGQIHYLDAYNQGSGQVQIAAGHSSGAISNIVSAQVTNPAGAWMNIAVAYDSVAQTMNLYLNGAVIASQTGVAAAPSSTATLLPVYVGSYGTMGYGVDGEVSGARVWTTALSAAQISTIYNYESVGTGNEPGFGIVVGPPSQDAYSPANPGMPYTVPTYVTAVGAAAPTLPVVIVPNNGFTGIPTFALNGLPAGASFTISPTQTPNAYTLQINGLTASGLGSGYPLVLSGTSNTVTAQAAAKLCLSVLDRAGDMNVDLSCFFNRGHNLATDRTTFTDGGLAGSGYAFSANLLGTTVTSGNVQFALGAPNGMNGLSATTISLPAGHYSSLAMLGTGIYGAQAAQTFTVIYTDGTTSTFTQSLSDWGTSSSYSGETVAATMAYTDLSNGTTSTGSYHLYSYSFALNNAKTVASITAPSNNNVIVMAISLKH